MNLCFSIFKRNFSDSALFQRAAAARFRINRRKIFHKVMGAGLLVFTNQVQRPFCIQKGFFALKKGASLPPRGTARRSPPERDRHIPYGSCFWGQALQSSSGQIPSCFLRAVAVQRSTRCCFDPFCFTFLCAFKKSLQSNITWSQRYSEKLAICASASGMPSRTHSHA